MGAGTVTSAVADAGPIIHLSEIDALQFLQVFDHLLILNEVWNETVGKRRVSASALMAFDFVPQEPSPVTDVAEFMISNSLSHLQHGEIEALFLCQSRSIPLLLTDDLAARDGAKRLNITLVGSLGILIRAYRKSLISLEDAKNRLMRLQKQSSLFVTPAIIELAMAEIDRKA